MSFVKHPDTVALAAYLRTLAVGEIVSWEELGSIIGAASCGPGTEGYPRLGSARNLLIQENIILGTVRGVGLKVLPDEDITAGGVKDTRAVRRKSAKALRKLAAVKDFPAMSDEKRREHLTASAQLGAIHQFSTAGARKRIAATVSDKPLALGRTLELFSAKKSPGKAS